MAKHKPLPKVVPMTLIQQATPFDHADWLFEIKHDGFRSLAYIQNGICKLVRRKDLDNKRLSDLAQARPPEIRAKDVILDGELVVLDRTGRARFNDLMAGRGSSSRHSI